VKKIQKYVYYKRFHSYVQIRRITGVHKALDRMKSTGGRKLAKLATVMKDVLDARLKTMLNKNALLLSRIFDLKEDFKIGENVEKRLCSYIARTQVSYYLQKSNETRLSNSHLLNGEDELEQELYGEVCNYVL